MEFLPDEIHIWLADLRFEKAILSGMSSVLSSEETERAERFVFEKDRNKFIASRAVLRLILTRYLHVPPKELKFQYGPAGKPCLTVASNPSNLQFNLSHSGDLALYAITKESPVGIDVEKIQRDVDYSEIAARFFSKQEIADFDSLPLDLRFEAFFRCWTRKEAYMKALGEGFSKPLNQFTVSVLPGRPAEISGDSLWVIQDIDVHPAYAAAVVTTAPVRQIKRFEFELDG